jgi:hypothetical protein
VISAESQPRRISFAKGMGNRYVFFVTINRNNEILGQGKMREASFDERGGEHEKK